MSDCRRNGILHVDRLPVVYRGGGMDRPSSVCGQRQSGSVPVCSGQTEMPGNREAIIVGINGSSQQNQESMGREIRRVRESKGMTREELVERLGEEYTVEAVRQYEDGSIPMGVDVLFAMTRALSITPNDITPNEVMDTAASGLGDYARLNGRNRRMVDQMIGVFLRQQRTGDS